MRRERNKEDQTRISKEHANKKYPQTPEYFCTAHFDTHKHKYIITPKHTPYPSTHSHQIILDEHHSFLLPLFPPTGHQEKTTKVDVDKKILSRESRKEVGHCFAIFPWRSEGWHAFIILPGGHPCMIGLFLFSFGTVFGFLLHT